MHKRSIPTLYKGIQFRSRLEATWAAMFDQFGWEWEYEPELAEIFPRRGGVGWIPDFIVRRQDRQVPGSDSESILVDVKPGASPDDLECHDELPRMLDNIGDSGYKLLLCGPQPDFANGCAWIGHVFTCNGEPYEERHLCWHAYLVGLDGVTQDWIDIVGLDGTFHTDALIGRFGLGSYLPVGFIVAHKVQAFWARAKNAAQWRPPGA